MGTILSGIINSSRSVACIVLIYVFRMWVLFAAELTALLVLLVPVLKQREMLFSQLGEGYISAILTTDKWFIRNQAVNNSLYNAALGIMVGWAWIGILKSECAETLTFTCPSSLDWHSFWLYTATVAGYVLLANAMYHSFIESVRMRKRVEKVAQLQQEDSKRCVVLYPSDYCAERVWPGSSKKSMPTVME